MAARLDSVAKFICQKSDWSVSNLGLQKLMYLCQMIYMGRQNGKRLFAGSFQAWDYGPVEPDLYHRAKVYGSSAIRDIFSGAREFDPSDIRVSIMNDVCDKFLDLSGGDLVEITHWDDGAWAKHYVPGARHIRIPDSDIWQEYKDRQNH